MNIDICKNCREQLLWRIFDYKIMGYAGCLCCSGRNYTDLRGVSIALLNNAQISLFSIIRNNNTEKNNFCDVDFTKKYDTEVLKSITINKICPFYAEHQLYDWNKEK